MADPTDVFGRLENKHTGSFTADQCILNLGNTELGIVQNGSFQYGQSVNRIYGIGKDVADKVIPVFYVAGRSQGTLSIGRIIGPGSNNLCDTYKSFGNVCNPQSLSVSFGDVACKPGSTRPANNAKITYNLTGCLLTNMGVSLAAQDMIVNENMQFMFASASCT